ncbi:uncharacterized protein LOC111717720 isoform X2 [Eurytemora carolleeae]|uniref:uncharacterized protein LOC111717720 isoform X2 n=1 Tax=Eurytemora carolleeae TaxID=1294199 RepID=UPI000C78AF60|nr:uncharacterized protein LOC111717720 isoform X2 [Eurytemora carolleeae]|eukprot:XP_023349111.1 uncharacterized protein LOC111717720 isoform X2 [Eurytemora affinis]
MNRLGQSTGLLIVAVTSTLAVIFLSLLVYQFHSETARFALQISSGRNICPGSIERLQLMPTAVSIELPVSTTLLPMAVQNEDITKSTAISSEKLRSNAKTSTTNHCNTDVLVNTIVENIQNSTSNISNSNGTQLQNECTEKLQFSTQIVSKVIHQLGVKCRKKSRIIKVYHHPQQAPLHSGAELETRLLVDTAVSDYIVRTTGTRQSNDVFASNIFEKLESLLLESRTQKKYSVHVTVFTSDGSEDYSLRTEDSSWVWTKQSNLPFGRKRILIVLISNGSTDVDRLDCLQHSAVNTKISSMCVGRPHECVRNAGEKTLEVYNACRKESNEGFGVVVICWGCDVWHRWSAGFPVLHVQNSDVWNNLVWAFHPLE